MVHNFVIDPPWPLEFSGPRTVRPNGKRALDYPTLSVSSIFQLLDFEVFIQAAPGHNVFLWGVERFLFDGEAEMQRRGYTRHVRLIWDKETGPAPAFTVRFAHEYCTWFYKSPMPPVVPAARGKFSSVIRGGRREHSRKPDALYAMIDEMYPGSGRMDVFSRERRPGWWQFGNQTDHFGPDDQPV